MEESKIIDALGLEVSEHIAEKFIQFWNDNLTEEEPAVSMEFLMNPPEDDNLQWFVALVQSHLHTYVGGFNDGIHDFMEIIPGIITQAFREVYDYRGENE